MSLQQIPEKSTRANRSRQVRGARACFRGLSAEDTVLRWYEAKGSRVLHRRWRGTAGEIDLIFEDHGVVVFCEVKSSNNTSRAAASLSQRQKMRICEAASEFLGSLPNGQLTEMRFDFAIVGASGVPQILQNAFGQE